MWDIFKSALADDRLYIAVVLVAVATASFGLGRLSMDAGAVSSTPGIVLATTSGAALTAAASVVADGANADIPSTVPEQLVGSKNGTKYHLLTCPGAKQIAEQNKVYFASVAAATAAGYTPAANCPGLQ